MEQQKALNALAPFLALTKSATSSHAAADLIERSTSATNTFIFSELLEAPQIRALSSSKIHSPYLKLLEIFSYGTYQNYHTTPYLPKLNAAQSLKLRQLSFLTLAKSPANLSYANLKRDLGLETQRQLEDLVISVIYAGLVECKLDPYNERVVVTSISPLRDLEPNSIPAMLKTLDMWSIRCVSTLVDLEKQIARIKAEAWEQHKDEASLEAEVNCLVDGGPVQNGETSLSGGIAMNFDISSTSKRSNRKLDEENSEAMDIDNSDEKEDCIKNTSRSTKKRGLGT